MAPFGSSIASRGLDGGLSRVTRGWVSATTLAAPIALPADTPLFSTAALDADGIPRLVYDEIVDVRYVDVSQSKFANPHDGYTGYAADGFWYEAGVADPTHVPFQATWAAEASVPSLNRGDLDRFPARIFVITTLKEVVIIDADTLKVWLRFVKEDLAYYGTNGCFLGQPDVLPRGATFLEGFLVVATNRGIRIADFRRDRAYILRKSSQTRSLLTGLFLRNSATYLDGTDVTNVVRALTDDDCTCVDAAAISDSLNGVRVHAVVGHPNGLTAVKVLADSITHPTTKRTALALSFALPWSAADDGDFDGTTPYFEEPVTNWQDKRVSPGDVLIDDLGDEYIVVEVQQALNRLVVTPEMPIRTGFGYSIRRAVTALLTRLDASLYYANGTYSVVVDRVLDWAEGATPLYVSASFETQKDQALIPIATSAINDLALSGTDVYIATSLGVCFATDADLEGGRNAEFRYSTTAVVDVLATNRILVGSGSNCSAVAVDPETGNIVVAVTGETSVVTEISPAIQQAFRFFDSLGSVNALVAYRNASGPPSVEVP